MTSVPSFLRLRLEAHPGSAIVQICLQDHSDYDQPHVHLMVHTRAPGETSPRAHEWQTLGINRGVFSTTQDIAARLNEAAKSANGRDVDISVHVHSDEKCKKTSEDFVHLLWSTCHTLTQDEAAALKAQDKGECPVCLTQLDAGDEVLCMPCDGAHSGHWGCMKPWLGKASTCPCCRFQLPSSNDERPQFDPLIESSLAAVKQIERDGEAFHRSVANRAAYASRVARAMAANRRSSADTAHVDGARALGQQRGPRDPKDLGHRHTTPPAMQQPTSTNIRSLGETLPRLPQLPAAVASPPAVASPSQVQRRPAAARGPRARLPALAKVLGSALRGR